MTEEQQDGGNEIKELYAKLDFGIEVENFLASRVGQYLIRYAEEERDAAVKQLKEVDAFDANAIRKLQDAIKRAESIQYWMAYAIQDGLNAEKMLKDQDE
jgi:hypothetical protein